MKEGERSVCEHLRGLDVDQLFSTCIRVWCFFVFLLSDLCFAVLSNQAGLKRSIFKAYKRCNTVKKK